MDVHRDREGAPRGGGGAAGSPARSGSTALRKSKSVHLPRASTLPWSPHPRERNFSDFTPGGGGVCVCVGGGERILMSFNSLPKFPNYLGSSPRREETHQAVAPSRLTPRAGSGGCTGRDRPLPRRRRRGWRRACVSCSPPAIGARSPPSVWG